MYREDPMQWLQQGRVIHAFIVWLAQGCANTVEVFWHKRFGQRYLGFHSLLALPVMVVFGGYWDSEGYDARPLAQFGIVYVLFLTLAIWGVAWRSWRGDIEHSRYSGLPRLFRPTTIKKELRIKEVYEPLVTIVIGLWITDLSSPPLGMWLVLAGVCLAGVNSLSRQFHHQQETAMQDAMIEQRARMEQARELQRRLGM
jgi:hypothetical protein